MFLFQYYAEHSIRFGENLFPAPFPEIMQMNIFCNAQLKNLCFYIIVSLPKSLQMNKKWERSDGNKKRQLS